MDSLEKAIRSIISGIPADSFFDVHMVIQKLLQEHDEVYLVNIGKYTSAAQYHAKISSIIGADIDLAECAGKSYSKNIHDKFSECNIFKRKFKIPPH
jgi:histone H3/H4